MTASSPGPCACSLGGPTTLDAVAVQTDAGSAGTARPGSGDDPGGGSAARGGQRPRQVTTKPALIFIGLVALVGIGGFAAAALWSRRDGTIPPSATTRLRGVGLAAAPATTVLKPILRGGEPPSDIATALVVPAGSRPTGSSCGLSLSLYDCATRFAVQARPSRVVAFYRAELTHEGWKILALDATGTGNGTILYAQRGSADGYYWEVGVKVEPVIPSISPALSGEGQTAPTSSVSLRVVERGDET
jgi:hypothetical protein